MIPSDQALLARNGIDDAVGDLEQNELRSISIDLPIVVQAQPPHAAAGELRLSVPRQDIVPGPQGVRVHQFATSYLPPLRITRKPQCTDAIEHGGDGWEAGTLPCRLV